MATKFVQMRSARLRSAIDDTATECILQEFVDLSGNPVLQTDFGTKGWGTFEPNTAREEAVEFEVTANTDGEATLTLIRGLRGKAPYGAGGTAFAHQAGSEFVVSNNPDLFNKLTAKDNDEEVTGSWKFPETPVHNQNPVTKKHFDDTGVKVTGDQTIAGVKTFTGAVKIEDSADADEPVSRAEIDAEAVKLTGNQTVAGVKTFSSSPIVPDATTAQQPLTKAQFDAAGESFSATASDTVRGTTKLDIAADDVLDPKALTATADRSAALAGGGDFGTPSASNKFLTEEYNTYLDGLKAGTFPTVVSTTAVAGVTSAGNLAISMPATISAGNLLLLFFHHATASTANASGWTRLSASASQRFHIFVKKAVGSDTLTITTDQNANAAYSVINVSNWSDTLDFSQIKILVNSGVNPPTLTPFETKKNCLWLTGQVHTGTGNYTNPPANYTNLITPTSNGSGIGVAQRNLNSLSDKPDTFTTSGTIGNAQTFTVAIRPSNA